ncbi:hypothetical protein DFA_10587 [Cavenderia fasciculata]|uniref:Uncharacterized protein n=1 Tax=Cavenderia fasciculata TaxID=261658 RepID=F4QAM5_CACFS|nr:uncharacterized protein DFA_10587 [Cavenderia fasciculata]EGG15744.1 hypothetical protein DFA_10587 [Cavenderia fasciculata]|eukprot:XP_004354491.1 hypothetical protein DFA_10587 [Cavenderia fasciculata]
MVEKIRDPDHRDGRVFLIVSLFSFAQRKVIVIVVQ